MNRDALSVDMICLLGFLFFLIFPSHVSAADICQATAIRDVSPTSGGSYVVTKGNTIGAVTQYIKTSLGDESFCSHGGGCFPRYVRLNGEQKVEAVRLLNCQIGKEIWRDEEQVVFSVEVVRSLNSEATLRFDDIENTLIDFGMGLAPADNAARFYIDKPDSRCARLVGQALEGNPSARRALAAGPPEFCHWDYSE